MKILPARKLKFATHLIPLILSGEKTTTWRLFDDKDIQAGDVISFIDRDTGKEFGKGEITWVSLKPLNVIGKEDMQGHEKFENFEEMLQVYRGYYGDKVTPDSVVKIISFIFALYE
jgi:hypothetical protein